MVNMNKLNQLVKSPSVCLTVIAGLFLFYMLKSYSNKQSMLLSNFENPYDGYQPQSVSSDSAPLEESLFQSNDAPASVVQNDSHDAINALLPNGESPQLGNLLNPDQIIGMTGQVKRNQTFDLRGNIPIPKQNIPFNNPVAVSDDVFTKGLTSLQ